MINLRVSASVLTVVLALWTASRAAGQAPGAAPTPIRFSTGAGPLRIAVVGMVHGHVEGLLQQGTRNNSAIQFVGFYEPNRAVFDKFAEKYKLDPKLYYSDLGTMLDAAKPEAVSVMGSIKDHRMAVEACAPRGVHLLLEKPLAYSNDDARAMADLARRNGILLLTNFETSWYASVREAKRLVDSGTMSPVRRMVFRDGHSGPIEIGCSQEFLAWLTDPDQNGGGAIVDFGCYGAVLSTWMMNGQRPLRVSASASTLKPNEYPRVDDDATIVISYPTATTVIQASWDWTHDNKDMDVFTDKGAIYCGKWEDLTLHDPNKPARIVKPAANPADLADTWTYLRQVVRGKCEVDPLSSLEMNVIAVEILDAARQDVRQHAQITPKP